MVPRAMINPKADSCKMSFRFMIVCFNKYIKNHKLNSQKNLAEYYSARPHLLTEKIRFRMILFIAFYAPKLTINMATIRLAMPFLQFLMQLKKITQAPHPI